MKWQRGSLFFGFFLLAKQKKETRKSRESDGFNLNSKWIPAFAGMTAKKHYPASQYPCALQRYALI
jgi:hypothetical protein